MLLWESVIRQSQLVNANVNPVALARLAAKSWSLLHRWRLSAAQLRQVAVSPDQTAFADWAAGFSAECAARGWITADELPAAYAKRLPELAAKPCESILLSGFADINPTQQQLFDSLINVGVSLQQVATESRRKSCNRYRYSDQGEELSAAASWARERLQSSPGESVAVLVPDLRERSAEVRRVMMDTLAPDWRRESGNYLAPVSLSCGQTLGDVGMISAALRLLRLPWQRLPFPEISLLLRSPYLREAREDAMPRAKAELKLRDAGIVDIYARPLAGKIGRWAPDMANLLLESPRWNLGEKRFPSGWAAEFAACLRYWGWPGEQLPENAEYQAYRAWEKVLDQFAACDGVLGEVGPAKAHRILRNLAAQEELQPEAAPAAVQVMGVTEAAGLQFDHLWITGLTADAWPPSGRADALIAASLQRELQMPHSTPAVSKLYADKLLGGLVESCPDPVLSWPGAADGEAALPAPVNIPGLVDADAEFAAAACHLRSIFHASQAVLSTLDDDPPPPAPRGAVKGGAALFARQAVCPARAFAEHRLGVSELPKAVTGLDPRAKGKLMHKALQLWYRKHPGQADLKAQSAEQRAAELAALIRSVVEPLEQKEQGVMAVVTAQEALRLQVIIENFFAIELQRLPYTVTGTEESLDGFDIAGLTVDLQLDRLDRLESGELLVIDYKSSEIKPGRWAPPRPADAQLPLYAITGDYSGIAVGAVSRREVSLKGVCDVDTGAPGIKPVNRHGKAFEEADWDSLLAEWRSSFNELASEFLNGDFRVNLRDAAEAEGEFGLLIRTSGLAVSVQESGDEDGGSGYD